ncbi:MAG: enolase C-terminal domain-like protein, partial [Bacteroidota bacterium]
MALTLEIFPYILDFTFAAGTSRGVLREKRTWFLKIWEDNSPEVFGLGEAGPLVGLSIDDRPDMASALEALIGRIAQADVPANLDEVFPWVQSLVPPEWPSIRFGLETALLDLLQGGQRMIVDSPFIRQERSILINGLVWMGDAPTMQQRLEEKLEQGFATIKVKIGAIDFEEELRLLALVRERFGPDQITLRVDANGAFSPEEAPQKLQQLAEFQLH